MRKALFLDPATDVVEDPPDKVLFDRIEPSWGLVYGRRTAPITAGAIFDVVTRSLESYFFNPVLNWLACGWHLFTVSVENESRTPFILFHDHDIRPVLETRRAWSEIRRQLLTSTVGDMVLTPPPLRALHLRVDYEWTIRDEEQERWPPAKEQEWTLPSEDYVRVGNFVALVDRAIEDCNVDVTANKNENGVYKFSKFCICWPGTDR